MSEQSARLSPGQIELINAYGPYNHARWTIPGVEVTGEEKLAGRGDFLVERIRESLLKHFEPEELRGFSIMDVGCYDGWILDQLSDLAFRRMVGIEPREKNVVKGQKIREILGLQTRAEFKIGDVETLGDEVFDIVICVGVLHHVESIPTALRRLRSVCGKLLFIETICLSSRHITNEVKREIEMKDVVYHSRPKVCGLTGQKLESAYYDGSSTELCVVSIPSVESLLMYLETLRFEDIAVVADPRTYRSSVWKGSRPMNAVAIAARVGKGDPEAEESSRVQDYEEGLVSTLLPMAVVRPLYERVCLGRGGFHPSFFNLLVSAYIHSPNWLSPALGRLASAGLTNEYELEIVKNLRFNPEDKLSFEYAKLLYQKGDLEGAKGVLSAITQKLNADWRSVYRSFYYLSRIYRDLGLSEEAERYRKLCLTANPKFPERLFEETGSLGSSPERRGDEGLVG